MRFTWAPLTLTWVGLLFQYPANNWDGTGLCMEEGANQVSFYARGDQGGEVVDFLALDVVASTVLTTTWTRYTIDLRGVDYNDFFFESGGVRGAFSIVLTRAADDLTAKTIYVDDVQWLQAEETAGGAGGASGVGGATASAGNGGAGGAEPWGNAGAAGAGGHP
jgi:hypothetical protein